MTKIGQFEIDQASADHLIIYHDKAEIHVMVDSHTVSAAIYNPYDIENEVPLSTAIITID